MRLPFLGKLDHHMREVVRGASIALALKVLAGGLGFAFNMVVARLLGAEGAGIYFQAFTVVTIAAVFGRVGLANTLVRFTATNAVAGNWSAVKGLYLKAMRIALAASLTVTILVALSGNWLADTVFSEPKLGEALWWMSFAIIPVSLSFLYSQMLKGLKRVGEALSTESVIISGISLLGTVALAPRWGVMGAIWAYMIASLITLAVGFWLWHGAIPQTRGLAGHFDTKELLRSSMPLFWVSLLQLVTHWSSTLMLGIWRTSGEVGVFAVANRTTLLIIYVLYAINSIAAPKLAALYSQEDMVGLGSTARSTAKLMIIAAAPVSVGFVLAPNWVMSLFGPQFSEHGMILAILTVGQFVNAATGSVQILLVTCGYERLLRNLTAVSAVIHVGANILLIPRWGVTGAAMATAMTYIVQNVIAAWLVRLRLGMWTIPGLGSGTADK